MALLFIALPSLDFEIGYASSSNVRRENNGAQSNLDRAGDMASRVWGPVSPVCLNAFGNFQKFAFRRTYVACWYSVCVSLVSLSLSLVRTKLQLSPKLHFYAPLVLLHACAAVNARLTPSQPCSCFRQVFCCRVSKMAGELKSNRGILSEEENATADILCEAGQVLGQFDSRAHRSHRNICSRRGLHLAPRTLTRSAFLPNASNSMDNTQAGWWRTLRMAGGC